MRHVWKAVEEDDGDQGKKRVVVIEARHTEMQIWVYICPNDPNHYYASPEWTR